MAFLEYMYYESLPYFYAGLAVYAYSNSDVSKVAGLAAVLLAFASYWVFQKRFQHRTYGKKYQSQIRL